ncbi:hypothetical protein [Pseudonocardia acidicola]|uniref:aromatic-ring hydroxylase C-terminal domain-containing protein n=1 Tax=Pseudonocardia acidicola TaxID=2724939 RepID=UPI003B837CE8
MRAVVIGDRAVEDPYRDWARIREIREAGALLVRPDGYIAWRQPAATWDDTAVARPVHLVQVDVVGLDGPAGPRPRE